MVCFCVVNLYPSSPNLLLLQQSHALPDRFSCSNTIAPATSSFQDLAILPACILASIAWHFPVVSIPGIYSKTSPLMWPGGIKLFLSVLFLPRPQVDCGPWCIAADQKKVRGQERTHPAILQFYWTTPSPFLWLNGQNKHSMSTLQSNRYLETNCWPGAQWLMGTVVWNGPSMNKSGV